MSSTKAHVAVFVDFASLARAGVSESAGTIAQAVLRYAGGAGKVTLARGYADWGARAADAKDVSGARIAPVLVLDGPSGEDRSHVQLSVDALTSLFAGGEPDAFVVASADARLLPLVQAVKADGCDVLFVAPAAAALDDVRAAADVVATLEEAVGGAVAPASEPRVEEDDDEEEEEPAPTRTPAARPAAPAPAPRPPPSYGREEFAPRGSRSPQGWGGGGGGRGGGEGAGGGGPGGYGGRARGFSTPAPLDLEGYDWASFVKLIDDLEHRLPFVGVRYLVNKVLGPRNCGIDDPRQKRDLINRAVDEGILEMYEVGNLEGRGDPVTACRLDRKNPTVVTVLGPETATPSVPENREDEAGEDDDGEGVIEGGLPLDPGVEAASAADASSDES